MTAQAPQQPHQQPNAPGVDSGTIGRLEDALAPFVRCGDRYCESFANGNRGCADCCARVIVVAALVDKHVTAALAEAAGRIEAAPDFTFKHSIDRTRAADIVYAYRKEVAR